MLERGHQALIDTDTPFRLELDSDSDLLTLRFARESVGLGAVRLSRVVNAPLRRDLPDATVVAGYLDALGAHIDELDDLTRHRYVKAARELVEALLQSAAPPTSLHEDLRERIDRFIEENISDPQLAPERIAAAHFISVRQLHALFRDQGLTVGALVRSRRLERCHDELSDPASAHLPVATIAARHGLIDAAQFSRMFRRQFGVAPSAVRRRAGGQ